MNLENILAEELSTLRQDIITRHEQAGQVATGQTRDTFKVHVTGPVSAELEMPAHLETLESGRAAGAIPAGFKDILLRWSQAKGLTFETDADFNRWAYFVSKKIHEEGTTLYRSGQTLDIYTTPMEEFEERLTTRISNHYYNKITNHLSQIK